MKRNRFLFTALMSAVFVSCSQEDSLQFTHDFPSNYSGAIENISSRVFLDQDYMMNWELEDELSIFPEYDINNLYKVEVINDEGLATFKYVDYVENEDYSEIPNTYAVYPYYDTNSLIGEKIYTYVPAEVNYKGMKNSIKYALMSAKSDTDKLNFTNAQGILRLNLNAITPFKYGPIQSIKFESTSNKLSGPAIIDYSTSQTPFAKIKSEGNNYLIINISEELQEDLPAYKSKQWAEFYIPIVPTEFEANDMKMIITWKNGGTYERFVGISFNIERRKIYTLSHTIGDVPTFEGELEGAKDDLDGEAI